MPSAARNIHELTVSFFVMTTAVCALGLTWHQIELSRTHNQLSTKPLINLYVQTWTPGDKVDGSFAEGLFLENKGLGPAEIRQISYFIDGKEVVGRGNSSPLDGMGEMLQAGRIIGNYETNDVDPGDYFKENDEEELFVVKSTDVMRRQDWLDFLHDKLRVVVRYCSIYDVCQTTCYPRNARGACE